MKPAGVIRTRTAPCLGSMGVAILLVTSCSPGSVPVTGPAASSPKPAISAPASQPVTTTAGPRARSCSGSDLLARIASRHPGDTQDVGVLVVFRNQSATPCVIAGTPNTSAEMSSGVTAVVPRDPLTSSLPPGWGRALLAHGSVAYLRFRAPSECASGANQTPPAYRRLTITIGRENISLTGLSIPGRCGLYESPIYTA